jgi:SSS family solute:Na+ symporter
MNTIDWIVLVATLLSIVAFGLYKSRSTRDLQGYLLAGKSMRWYTVAFSIMATQASAITFASTPGQAYADGMRFVQYYFGLPIAMVIISITALPLYRRLNVYTAYEYLEHRFDLKTRTLTSVLFMIQRGLGAGMTIYAPSLILSVMLGWDIGVTSAVIGGAIILYTTTGGVRAVSWTHLQQLTVVMIGMIVAFVTAIVLLPSDVSFVDALRVAGVSGRMNIVDFSFYWTNR